MAFAPTSTRTNTAITTVGLALLGVGAILAGCNLAEQRPPAVGGAPRVQSRTGFFYNPDSEMPSFGYGVLNSDVIDVMATCPAGSGQVHLAFAVDDKAPRGQKLTVASGAVTGDFPAALEDGGPAGQMAGIKVSSRNPALVKFRDSGKLSLRYGRVSMMLSATTAEKAMAARFFSDCEKRRR